MYEQQFNPFAANIAIVKGYFKSGKVLTLAILNVIMAIMGFLGSVTAVDTYYDLVRSMGILDYRTVSSFRTGYYFGAFVGSLWYVLMAVGFFLIFAKSRNTSPESSPRGGINLLKVLAVFQLIGSIFVAIILVILAFICIAGSSSIAYALRSYLNYSYMDSSSLVAISIFFAFIALLYAFFLMFLAINRLRFLNSAKRSMNAVDLYYGGASAYGVVNIIMAVFTGLTLIGSIFSFGGLSIVTNILNLLLYIFTAALALGYSNYIKRQKMGYNSNQINPSAPSPQIPYASAPAEPNPYASSAPAEPNPYASSAPSYSAPVNEQPRSGNFCDNCGAPVGPNDPFCGNCGKKL